MTFLEVGDHVEVVTLKALTTPKGLEIKIRPPESGIGPGHFGVVKNITKTGSGATLPLSTLSPHSAKVPTYPPAPSPAYYPPHLWYVAIECQDGRSGTFLAGQLRKLSLLEVLAWAAQ